jgi:hypothetical protein
MGIRPVACHCTDSAQLKGKYVEGSSEVQFVVLASHVPGRSDQNHETPVSIVSLDRDFSSSIQREN